VKKVTPTRDLMDDQIVIASSRMITYLMIDAGEIHLRYPWTSMENIKEQIETSIVSVGPACGSSI